MKWLFTISLLLISRLVYPQQADILQVIDAKTSIPLVGAHVFAWPTVQVIAVTDTAGKFLLKNDLKVDSILISYIGYSEQVLPIEHLKEDLAIQLSPLKKVLQEVSVKATKLGAEVFAIEQLKPIDIYLNPVSKADPLVAVNTTGASTTKDENAAVNFRGATVNATGYFLNGVPLKNPVKYAQLTNTGTLSIFNTDFLKEVTVFAGNPPLEYGQATSGAIVLEMADRFPDFGQHTASISMASLGYAYRNKVGKNTYLGVYGNYQFDQVLQGVNPENFEDINNFQSADAGLLLVTHQPWGSLKFYQYGLLDNYSFSFDHPSYQGNFLQNAQRSISTLKWTQDFNNAQVSAIFGHTASRNTFDFGNLQFTELASEPYAAVNFMSSKNNHFWKSGYSVWSQHSLADGQLSAFDFALAPTDPSFQLNAELRGTIHEAYSFYRFKYEKLSLAAGARLGHIAETAEQAAAYQLSGRYAFNKNLDMKLGHGNYYQLTVEDSIALLRSTQTALDISYRQNKVALTQSFYRNKLNNNQLLYGTETTFSYAPTAKLTLDQSVSYILNANEDDWFVRSTLQYQLAELWTLTGIFQTYRGLPFRQVNSASFNETLEVYEPDFDMQSSYFSPYHNLSFTINRLIQFSDKLSGIGFLTINNIYDAKNERSLDYNFNYQRFTENYLTRRSIYAGIILNFVEPKK